MLVKTNAIVISTVKYGESSLITRCYCKELGLNKNEIVSEAKSEIFEKKYISNTDSAREINVFGSPSFIVENEIFWGDDRMEDAINWAKK